MRIAVLERHPDVKDNVWTVINIPDDADIEVDIIEEDEEHWANAVTARRLTVAKLRDLLTGGRTAKGEMAVYRAIRNVMREHAVPEVPDYDLAGAFEAAVQDVLR